MSGFPCSGGGLKWVGLRCDDDWAWTHWSSTNYFLVCDVWNLAFVECK